MKATPRIHPDNDVTLDLSFDISSLTTQSFNAIPVISNEAVQQIVRLKENETAVVAGFRSNATLQRHHREIREFPIFRASACSIRIANKQDQDTQLLILVTPRLVRLAPAQGSRNLCRARVARSIRRREV